MIYAILLAVAAVALLARSALRHGGDETFWFIGNVVMLWVTSTMLFGYPGMIVPALMIVPTILGTLVLLTQGK